MNRAGQTPMMGIMRRYLNLLAISLFLLSNTKTEMQVDRYTRASSKTVELISANSPPISETSIKCIRWAKVLPEQVRTDPVLSCLLS
jgi:hypothetical protein